VAECAGFKYSVIKIINICLLLSGLFLPADLKAADENFDQIEARKTAESFFEKIEQFSADSSAQDRRISVSHESALFFREFFADTLARYFYTDFILSKWVVLGVSLEADESRDFRMLNMQNEVFADYIRLEKDSRYYAVLLNSLASLQNKMPGECISRKPAPAAQVSFQNSSFVHKDHIKKYRDIELSLHNLYKEVFETAFLKADIKKNSDAVFTALTASSKLVEELQKYEVGERVLEQLSKISLAYRLHKFYQKDHRKMEALIGKDYRELTGSGSWNFKIYKAECDVIINTCPQCRGLRIEEQKWEIIIVNFKTDDFNSGWQVWSVNKISRLER